MKNTDLLKKLDEMDRQGTYLFTLNCFKVMFETESDVSIKMSLRRHCKSGLLKKVAHNLYVNERADSFPFHRKLEALVDYLKPNEVNYLSRESLLGDTARISQQMMSFLTVSTTGSSKVFETEYGVIEFTHTKQKPNKIKKQISKNPETGLWEADEKLAHLELKYSRRNLDMVMESSNG